MAVLYVSPKMSLPPNGLLTLGVIPARAGASRFPNKIMAPILGKPMIERVWSAACQARLLSTVVVATDSEVALKSILDVGGKAVFTPGEFASGTDRVAFVAQDHPAEIIVNIQGDEPLLDPSGIDQLVQRLLEEPGLPMATLAVQRRDEGLSDPNVVKVVTDHAGTALYFSRAPLALDDKGNYLKHLGIYAYRRDALFKFCDLEPSSLEKAERLEQLRALQNGFRIAVCLVDFDTVAVDVPSDIVKVERVLKERS